MECRIAFYLQPTYEELKPDQVRRRHLAEKDLQPTYEELKPQKSDSKLFPNRFAAYL